MNKATKLQVFNLALKLAEARSAADWERSEGGMDDRPLKAAELWEEQALADLKAALGLR